MKRFTAVEVSIFTFVTIIFSFSVYSLFLSKKHENKLSTRKPASIEAQQITQGFISYETQCKSEGESMQTNASKIRVLGPLCGHQPSFILRECTAQNITNRYIATVFTETNQKTFSTDFIPLQDGKNELVLECFYKKRTANNKIILTILKN